LPTFGFSALGQTAPADPPVFAARLMASEEAEIAARIDGRVSRINFVPGQIVKKGDVLIEFDQKFRNLSLAAAQAKVKTAEAQLKLADAKLRNAQTLRTRNVNSEVQLLEAQAQRDIAAAAVEEAKVNVQTAQLQLDQTTLKAGIDGIISRAQVREGAYLTLQAMDVNRLALISRINPIHAAVEVPFEWFQQRRKAFASRDDALSMLSYTLVLPNGEKYPLSGRIVAGAGEFDPATQRMTVNVEFANPEYLLRPGLSVKVESSAR
jgi:membrane fusion protein (multidrug efflux system)